MKKKKQLIEAFAESRSKTIVENLIPNEVLQKARKYDELEKIVASFYVEEDGSEKEEVAGEDGGGLMAIGERVAMFFGYL